MSGPMPWKGVMCGLLLVLSMPWSPALAAAKEQGNPYLEKAKTLYVEEAFKFDASLQMLEKAKKWPSNTPEQWVSIALLEGVLHYEKHQPEQSEAAFRRALTLDRTAQIPFDVSPTITQFLEKLRKDYPPEPTPSFPRPEPTSKTPTVGTDVSHTSSLSKYRTPLAIAGGGVAVVGALSWLRALSLSRQIKQQDASITTREQLDGLVSQGRTFETAGWILMGAGAATALGSLLLIPTAPSTPTVTVVPMSGGAHASLLWSLP